MADATAIFTAAEARAFDKKYLADAQVFTDAVITAAEIAIRTKFERIIGVALIPTTYTEYLDGTGWNVLALPHHNPFASATPSPVTLTSVTYLDFDDAPDGGTAFTAAELADIVCYPDKIVRRSGYFTRGYRNYKVVYKTGYATCPTDIKNAALQTLLLPPPDGIHPSSAPSAVIDGLDSLGGSTINWSRVKDPSRGRWFGNEAIDAVLREHRGIENLAVFA